MYVTVILDPRRAAPDFPSFALVRISYFSPFGFENLSETSGFVGVDLVLVALAGSSAVQARACLAEDLVLSLVPPDLVFLTGSWLSLMGSLKTTVFCGLLEVSIGAVAR